jgi:hypothetical protein
MLEKNPVERIILKDILKHPWVTKNYQEKIEVEQVDVFDNGNLGNVDRLVKLKKLNQGTTFHNTRNPIKDSLKISRMQII